MASTRADRAFTPHRSRVRSSRPRSITPVSDTIVAPAIDVREVTRVYSAKPKDVTALAGVDLLVEPGTFFGLLGPNGAGKTTLIKIMTTLLMPTTGTVKVFGFDVATDAKKIRRIMNMVAGGEQS